MSIEATVLVTIAEVEVNDAGLVELRLRRKREAFTVGEAEQLANEIISAIEDVHRMEREDAQPMVHGFDVGPTCRECGEGKHGACDGTTIVISDDDEPGLDDCGCALAGHKVYARLLSPAELAEVVRFGLDKPEQAS